MCVLCSFRRRYPGKQYYRADFLYENLAIQMNVINGSYLAGVAKIVFLGSSCIYPRDCDQPIKKSIYYQVLWNILMNPMIAKIAGIKLCESYNDQYDTEFISLMPTNLYGRTTIMILKLVMCFRL